MLESILSKIETVEAIPKDSHTAVPYKGLTNYRYSFVNYDFKQDDLLVNEVLDKLNLLYEPLLGMKADRSKLNVNAFWAKIFEPDSNIEMHVETVGTYGPVIFLLYLSDEVDGALNLPDETTARKKFWSDGFQEIYDSFAVKFVGPYRFIPRKNTCIVMRVDCAHLVEPCSGLRPTLQGWSFNSATFGGKSHNPDALPD